MDLRARAEAFLRRPFPPGQRAPGNLSDGLIARYLAGGPWDDPELVEMLDLCIALARDESAQAGGELRAFYAESAAVLEAIRVAVVPG